MRTRNLIVWLTLCLLAPACADETPVDDSTRVAPATETHGEKQVRAMVADRPEMARIVSPGDPVWNWVARRFDGEGYSFRIYWDGATSASEAVASHDSPFQGLGARIRVAPRDKTRRGAEWSWMLAVYELLNQAGSFQFENMYQQALEGRVSRSDYLKGTMRIEYWALKRLRYFGLTIWKEHAKSRGFKPDPRAWRVKLGTFEEHFDKMSAHGPGQLYMGGILSRYDRKIVPHLKRMEIPIPK